MVEKAVDRNYTIVVFPVDRRFLGPKKLHSTGTLGFRGFEATWKLFSTEQTDFPASRPLVLHHHGVGRMSAPRPQFLVTSR